MSHIDVSDHAINATVAAIATVAVEKVRCWNGSLPVS